PAKARATEGGTEPAPPCVREEDQHPIYEYISHRELGMELRRIAQTSDGELAVERFARTNRGRALWKATVGTGDKVVLVTSEIHGDEKTGTEALVRLLDTLATSDAPGVRRLRDELTVVAVPKFNADGAELDR